MFARRHTHGQPSRARPHPLTWAGRAPAPAARGRPRLRRLATVAAAASVVLAGLPGAAPAAPTAAPAPRGPAEGGQAAQRADEVPALTLITGDQVRVGLGPDGTPVVQEVVPAPWRDGSVAYQTFTREGTVYVVPEEAGSLLAAGVLDWNLFNVVELGKIAATGRIGEVPVVIEPSDSLASGRVMAASAPGMIAGEPLPVVGFPTATITGDGTWWQATSAATAAAPDDRARLTAGGPLAGVGKIWLDPVYTIALDESVPQVNAPVAWERGLDGTGVTVAVLDTGIDATHPDVAGKIVEAVDFTGNPNGPVDGHGHGTHVAATIAGTGAASGGLRRGVAPGASLLIGKVCNDNGGCPAQAILDGMAWAAQSGARIVSMSLGGAPTDGTDPLSQAVNALSAEFGTLFVIAAGNNGPSSHTVGTPGAADAALTVAAVDKDDQMAAFSSRGPRLGDGAPKPDIAAPGVGIVAARAAGTSLGTPVDEFYTAASGTSMATPHVSGAAAVLAQQHPELAGSELKALLMSTARDLTFDPEAQGAGRLDVGEAVAPTVFADGPVTFGRQVYPHEPVTHTIVYQNLTDQPVTLDLEATFAAASSGEPAAPGLLTLESNQVTVPARGTASVAVVLDGRVLEGTDDYGRYRGAVRAVDSHGEVRASSLTTAFVEPPRREVSLTVIPPEGVTRVGGNLSVVAMDENVALHDEPLQLRVPAPTTTLNLFDGVYNVQGLLSWTDERGSNRAFPTVPEVVVDGEAVEVELDLREARPAYTETPVTTQSLHVSFGLHRGSATGNAGVAASFVQAGYATDAPAPWILPTEPVQTGTFVLHVQEVRVPPPVTLRVTGGGPMLRVDPRYQDADGVVVGGNQRWIDGEMTHVREVLLPVPQLPPGTAPVVYAGRGTPEDLATVDVRGALVLLDVSDCGTTCRFSPGSDLWNRLQALADLGAVGVLAFADSRRVQPVRATATYSCPDAWDSCPAVEPYAPLPIAALSAEHAADLVERWNAGARLQGSVGGHERVPGVYALAHAVDHVPHQLPWRVSAGDLDRVEHRFHADGPGEVVGWTWLAQDRAHPFLGGSGIAMPDVPAQSVLPVYHGPPDVGLAHQYRAVHAPYVAPFVVPSSLQAVAEGLALAPGRAVASWGLPPFTPGPAGGATSRPTSLLTLFAQVCAGCRQGDTFYPAFYRTTANGNQSQVIGALNDTGAMKTVIGEDACEPPRCVIRLFDAAGSELPQRLIPISIGIGAELTDVDSVAGLIHEEANR